ncbi:GrpB family protein [Dongia sp. agr-C8]
MLSAFPVRLVDYHPDWPRQAMERIARLRVLEPVLLAVHHIGSTAVPGLIAKPIIDLMPLVSDLTALDLERGAVEALGYRWHGEVGIPGRRYCTAEIGDRRVAQLHFFTMGSPAARRHLAFRDYLRAHPGAAAAYAAVKRRARDLHPGDSHAYGAEKQPWIDQAEAQALAWYSARGA